MSNPVGQFRDVSGQPRVPAGSPRGGEWTDSGSTWAGRGPGSGRFDILLVGGAVRDQAAADLSGDGPAQVNDADFVVVGPRDHAELVKGLEDRGFRVFTQDEETYTVRAKVPDSMPELKAMADTADFVLARRDSDKTTGRRPDQVEPGTLGEDLARRDFTVNAMARTPDGEIIDLHGGMKDLESGTLRFVGDPHKRVAEDALRVMRGFRFMVTKGLTPDPATWSALTSQQAADGLNARTADGKRVVSLERMRGELNKMFSADTPGTLDLLARLPKHVRDAMFPEGLRVEGTLRKGTFAVEAWVDDLVGQFASSERPRRSRFVEEPKFVRWVDDDEDTAAFRDVSGQPRVGKGHPDGGEWTKEGAVAASKASAAKRAASKKKAAPPKPVKSEVPKAQRQRLMQEADDLIYDSSIVSDLEQSGWVSPFGDGYDEIRDDLRDGGTTSKATDKFLSVLDRAPTEEMTCFRGLDMNPDPAKWEAKVGKSMEIDVPGSASIEPAVAGNFAMGVRRKNGVILRVRTKAAYLGEMTGIEEHEVVIPPGEYRVVSVEAGVEVAGFVSKEWGDTPGHKNMTVVTIERVPPKGERATADVASIIRAHHKKVHGKPADFTVGQFRDVSGQPRVPAGNPDGGEWTDGTANVAISDIVPENNDRKSFDPEALQALADSIAKSGLAQPITIRPRPEHMGEGPPYVIVAGERRWRAMQLLGKTEIPAIIKNYTDEEASNVMLAENVARSDLNPMDEANAYGSRMEKYGYSVDELVEATGVSKKRIQTYLPLLKLAPEIAAQVQSGQMPMGHALALVNNAGGALDANRQHLAYQAWLKDDLSVAQLRHVTSKLLDEQNQGSMFDPNDFMQVEQWSREAKQSKVSKAKIVDTMAELADALAQHDPHHPAVKQAGKILGRRFRQRKPKANTPPPRKETVDKNPWWAEAGWGDDPAWMHEPDTLVAAAGDPDGLDPNTEAGYLDLLDWLYSNLSAFDPDDPALDAAESTVDPYGDGRLEGIAALTIGQFYRRDQPRVPAGSPHGGEWADGPDAPQTSGKVGDVEWQQNRLTPVSTTWGQIAAKYLTEPDRRYADSMWGEMLREQGIHPGDLLHQATPPYGKRLDLPNAGERKVLDSPVSMFGLTYDERAASSAEVKAAREWDHWDEVPVQEMSLDQPIIATENLLSSYSIDKVTSGKEAFREGYYVQVMLNDRGIPVVIDGHHRFGMYKALGRKTIPAKIIKGAPKRRRQPPAQEALFPSDNPNQGTMFTNDDTNTDGQFFRQDQPRVPAGQSGGGRWTDGESGGGSGGGEAGPSKPAKLTSDGQIPPEEIKRIQSQDGPVVHAKNADEAVEALLAGKKVEIENTGEIAVMLDKIRDYVALAKKKGDDAPDLNLCSVTLKGTSLFCVGNKGIPRIGMPQFSGFPKPGSKGDALPRDENGGVNVQAQFVEHLTSKGVKLTDRDVEAATLKATQNELVGAKVAGIARAVESGSKDPGLGDRLFVSRDGYVLDGHHRWAAMVGADTRDGRLGNDYRVPVTVIDMDILDIVVAANDFTDEWGLPRKAGSGPNAGAAAAGWAQDRLGYLYVPDRMDFQIDRDALEEEARERRRSAALAATATALLASMPD